MKKVMKRVDGDEKESNDPDVGGTYAQCPPACFTTSPPHPTPHSCRQAQSTTAMSLAQRSTSSFFDQLTPIHPCQHSLAPHSTEPSTPQQATDRTRPSFHPGHPNSEPPLRPVDLYLGRPSSPEPGLRGCFHDRVGRSSKEGGAGVQARRVTAAGPCADAGGGGSGRVRRGARGRAGVSGAEAEAWLGGGGGAGQERSQLGAPCYGSLVGGRACTRPPAAISRLTAV